MAVVWIVTTGNSDVKLTTKENWVHLLGKKSNQLDRSYYKNFQSLGDNNNDNLLTSSARVLGIVYGDRFETHFHVLKFPRFDGFC